MQKEALQKVLRQGLREEDIEEKFIRSSGPGGQNVNKVSTCVYLKHIPTGIEVKCQEERTQAQNRQRARELLLKKMNNLLRKNLTEERKRIEKLRRQKRKRPLGLKLRILEEKRKHSQKKSLRSPIRNIEL